MKNLFLLLASTAVLSAAYAAPRGHLSYLKDDYAVVSDAATGRATRLPHSKGAQAFAVSPRGLAVYFTAPPGEKSEGPVSQTGWLSAAPYRSAKKLPSALQDETFGILSWNPSGTMLWLRGFEISGAFAPATGQFDRRAELPDTVSRDGKTVAFWKGDEIRVRDASSGRGRTIWSQKKPQVLMDALKRAKNPAKLRDLTSTIDPTMGKQADNWATSTPALTPDGSRLFFCSNVGTGQGASGNSTWAIFACDLKTGRIEVLSKIGAQFGRMPDVFEVSPDGKRLMALVSAHSSAVENPCFLLVVDLLTQNSRELIGKIAPRATDNNLVEGVSWSPDGKYIATSATFFKTADAWKNLDKGNTNGDGPPDKDWTLYIQDAATGKVVRRIAGAREPSWGN